MTELPQAAIDAAVQAIATYRQQTRGVHQTTADMAACAITAAEPHIAAVERERIRQLALTEAIKAHASSFSTADPIVAGALEDFAELLTDPEGTTT